MLDMLRRSATLEAEVFLLRKIARYARKAVSALDGTDMLVIGDEGLRALARLTRVLDEYEGEAATNSLACRKSWTNFANSTKRR